MDNYKTYALIDPDECTVGYIGVTSQQELTNRLTQHISEAQSGKGGEAKREWISDIVESGAFPSIMELPPPLPWELDHLPAAVNSYGEVLDEADWERAERYWIWRFRQFFELTNDADGGLGNKGTTRSEETREKISTSLKEYNASNV